MQVFAQHNLVRTLHVLAPGAACEVRLAVPTVIHYSVSTGTAPGPETLPDTVIATTLVDPTGTEVSTHIFNSNYVWLVIGVVGTGTLRLVRQADTDNIDTWLPANSQWYVACWIANARPTLDFQQA